MFFLAVIGGGPAGYSIAAELSEAGKKVILFEKESLGGTCLNVGCIPTKTLLYSAKQYYNAIHGSLYGVSAENVSFDYSKMMQRKTKVIRKLVAGIKHKCSNENCTIVTGTANILPQTCQNDDNASCRIIECNGQQYEAQNVLICTGSDNFVPPIPGIKDNENIWDSTMALSSSELPKSIIIVGGGVIGMEFATLYSELGVDVTVIEAMPDILPNLDVDIVKLLSDTYIKKGIKILTNTRVLEIRGEEVITEQGQYKADRILVAVGRRAHLEGVDSIGLSMTKGYIDVDEFMRTNIPGIYAAGDVTGKIMLAHVASKQAHVAMKHMLCGDTDEKMDYSAVPSVVYTNPELASVGKRLSDNNDPILTSVQIPMTYSGRFVAENDGINGLCKVVFNRGSQMIEGVHLFGNPSSEFICVATIAVNEHYTLDKFRNIFFPHPTVSEIFKDI